MHDERKQSDLARLTDGGGCAHIFVCAGYRVDGNGGWDQGDRWDNRKIVLDPYGPLVVREAFKLLFPQPVCSDFFR